MSEEDILKVEVIAEFKACPWCGSTRMMMRELGKEMMEKGLVREGLAIGLSEVGGTIIDPATTGQMLSVSIRRGRYALRDICVGCGREVTTRIEEKPVKIGIGLPADVGGSLLPSRG